MMKNKKGFTLGGFVIGLIALSMLVVGFALMHRSLTVEYGNGSPDLLDKYNYSADLVSVVNNASDTTLGDDLEVKGFFTTGSWSAAKSILGSMSTFKRMVVDVVTDVPNFPPWVVAGFVAIISIILVLIILSAIFRYRLV
jgi:hypothetical protein